VSKHEMSDGTDIDCPECGELNDMTDPNIDGCLEKGYEFNCYKCGQLMEITAVYYEITFNVSTVSHWDKFCRLWDDLGRHITFLQMYGKSTGKPLKMRKLS